MGTGARRDIGGTSSTRHGPDPAKPLPRCTRGRPTSRRSARTPSGQIDHGGLAAVPAGARFHGPPLAGSPCLVTPPQQSDRCSQPPASRTPRYKKERGASAWMTHPARLNTVRLALPHRQGSKGCRTLGGMRRGWKTPPANRLALGVAPRGETPLKSNMPSLSRPVPAAHRIRQPRWERASRRTITPAIALKDGSTRLGCSARARKKRRGRRGRCDPTRLPFGMRSTVSRAARARDERLRSGPTRGGRGRARGCANRCWPDGGRA